MPYRRAIRSASVNCSSSPNTRPTSIRSNRSSPSSSTCCATPQRARSKLSSMRSASCSTPSPHRNAPLPRKRRIQANLKTSALIKRIEGTLEKMIPAARIGREVAIKGRSGGERRFDFAIRREDKHSLLINGVSPHHASISSKYVAFSDSDGDREDKLAVYARPLQTDDTALLQQVATIVPIAALEGRAERSLLRVT